MTKKPPLKTLAMMLQAQAPEGAKLPEWIDRAAARKTGYKKGNPEEDVQKALIGWMKYQPGLFYFSVPNHFYLGGSDSGKVSHYIAKQKSLGLTNGVSDLVILFRSKHGQPTAVFAEVKAGSNKASEAQEAFLDRVNSFGFYGGIVKSLEDLKDLLIKAGYVTHSNSQ